LPSFSYLSLPSLAPFLFPLLSLVSRAPEMQLRGLKECCKLPQWDGVEPSQNQILCVLALQNDTW